MMDTKTFANAIGRKNMADALGVLPTAISNAVVKGAFPPSWLVVCQKLALVEGVNCPPALFNQRGFHNQSFDAPSSEGAALEGSLPDTDDGHDHEAGQPVLLVKIEGTT